MSPVHYSYSTVQYSQYNVIAVTVTKQCNWSELDE